MRYLTGMDRKRAAEWRAQNPDAPETSDERAMRRQAEVEGKAQAQADVKERAAAREAAIPDHERRPTNSARVVYENRKAQDRPGNRQSKTILASLKRAADEREAEIEKIMAEKERQYKIDHSPECQNAIANAEFALKANPHDPERARALAIAMEGDAKGYWTLCRDLDTQAAEAEKTKTVALATEKSAADAAHLEQKRRSDEAFARAEATLQECKKMLADEPKGDANGQ